MPEGHCSRLFWEAVDGVEYAVMDARLRLFELIYGPEPPTPADEKREAHRNGTKELPAIDFGAFMATANGSRDTNSIDVKRHAIGTPDRHGKGTPHRPRNRLVPVANRRAPRASRSALTSDGAARVGGALYGALIVKCFGLAGSP